MMVKPSSTSSFHTSGRGALHLPLLLLVLCTISGHAHITTYVNVHMPHSLHIEHGYNHSISHFGYNSIGTGSHRYHGSMAFNVFSADSDLCELKHAATNSTWNYHAPFALLASRGNCTFATKARHAQMAGAAVLFIANNICLCADKGEGDSAKCKPNPNIQPECEEELPTLADDGSGRDVSIPAILLKKQDGENILTQLQKPKQNGAVLMDMRWYPTTITNASDAVFSYGMVVDLHDNYTAALMQQMKPLAYALGKKAYFYPTYMFYDGLQSQCLGNTDEEFCYQVCTNNGRYCFPSQHVPGTTIVKEILHRLCIWKHHGEADTENPHVSIVGEAWWEYVTYFDQHCQEHWRDTTALGGGETVLEKCTEQAYKHAKIKKDDVDDCIKLTGGLDTEKANILLDAQLNARKEYGVHVAPTVWIQGQGGLSWEPPTATTILKNICRGFESPDNANLKNKATPDVCTCLSKTKDDELVKCAQTYATKQQQKHPSSGGGGGGHFFRTFFWVIFFVGVLGGTGYFVYTKVVVPRRINALSDGLSRYAVLSDQPPPVDGTTTAGTEQISFTG